jgi:hypothetical protein
LHIFRQISKFTLTFVQNINQFSRIIVERVTYIVNRFDVF